MKKTVSVVIPVYNVKNYIDRCVESVVNQTYSDLEIILVDDGSTDGCSKICDQWADKDERIKVIHKKNAGLGMARNSGLNTASGDYICFFDSDDYVDESLVKKCLDAAESNKADVVLFGRNDVYDNGVIESRKITPKEEVFYADSIKNDLLPGLFTYDLGFGVSVWSKFFNLNSIKSNNICFKSEREVVSEDAFFCLEYFSRAFIAVALPENLYYYSKRDNSLSRNFDADRQKKNDDFYLKSLSYIRDNDLSENVELHLKARYHTLSLVSMKQVVASSLQLEEKKNLIKEFFRNKVLLESLGYEAIRLAIPQSRIFWLLFKLKLFNICFILLKYKADR